MAPRLPDRARTSLAVIVSVLDLGGCAVGPNYKSPAVDPPSRFEAMSHLAVAPATPAAAGSDPGAAVSAAVPAAVVPDIANWWHALGDAELDSLVERAVRHNYDVAIALTRLQQARAYETLAIGRALPEVDATGAAGRGTGSDLARGRAAQSLVSADNTSGLEHINTLGGFDAVWEVDVFGKYRREIEAARFDAQALTAARNGVLVSVVADVVRAYVDLRGLQAQQAILAKAREVLGESLRIVNIRYARGITNELDITLAARELAALEAEIAPLAAQTRAVEYALAVLLGEYPEKLFPELATPAPVPSMPGTMDPGLPLTVLRRRPDVQQAERELAAATARIGIATADLFPQISLVAAIGAQGQGWGAAPAVGKRIWSFGPGAFWPVLDFGALDAQVEIASLEARAHLYQYRKTILTAVEEVDTAVDAYGAQQDRLQQLGNGVAAGDRAVTLANQRYERGLTDFLNVIDAERQFYDLEGQYVGAQVAGAEQFIQIYKSLGGGWQNYQSVPAARRPLPAVVAAFRSLFTSAP
jgi:NodT family efflux transporter outer membrane factor (OMF) lipoprotein